MAVMQRTVLHDVRAVSLAQPDAATNYIGIDAAGCS